MTENYGQKFGMTRRDFAKMLGCAAVLGLVDVSGTEAQVLGESKKSLFALANGTARTEGEWQLMRIEGNLPPGLNGNLFRVCPGQKETFGVKMKHLFDGDAFLSRYNFRNGKVFLKAKFLETPQRLEELQTKQMLYSEFGTVRPAPPADYKRRHGGKNQPSVNVIRWDGRLLGLSEGAHPTAIDPETLAFQGEWDFYGTLPKDLSFTAHPKFDPVTGEGYTYGIKKGMGLTLTVFRMEKNGKLANIGVFPQRDFFMVHDVTMSENYLIFVIPPVKYDLPTLQSGKATPADALRYAEREPTRILILRKDGTGKPIEIEQPAAMVFHHGNAFERSGKLIFDSLLTPDGSVLQTLHSLANDKIPNSTPNNLTRFTIDLASGKLDSRIQFGSNHEFPRFDSRLTGKDARFLYTAGAETHGFLESLAIMRHDLRTGVAKKIAAGRNRIFGEPVFVPQAGKNSEESGWILAQGYDAGRHESFLEIRDAATMDFAARVWTGNYIPLGFHGNFYAV